MRELIWSKTFIRAAKKAIKKNPKLFREIESTLNGWSRALLPQNSKHTSLKANYQDHGHVVLIII